MAARLSRPPRPTALTAQVPELTQHALMSQFKAIGINED